jgi:hypothetical protein
MENQNKPEQLESITTRILQNLKYLQAAPSVQMHAVPPDWVVASAGIPLQHRIHTSPRIYTLLLSVTPLLLHSL